MSQVTKFDPTILQEEVQRLFRKLGDTRLPEQPIVPDAGWDYGERLRCSTSSFSSSFLPSSSSPSECGIEDGHQLMWFRTRARVDQEAVQLLAARLLLGRLASRYFGMAALYHRDRGFESAFHP
jgi:hypothetical protein